MPMTDIALNNTENNQDELKRNWQIIRCELLYSDSVVNHFSVRYQVMAWPRKVRSSQQQLQMTSSSKTFFLVHFISVRHSVYAIENWFIVLSLFCHFQMFRLAKLGECCLFWVSWFNTVMYWTYIPLTYFGFILCKLSRRLLLSKRIQLFWRIHFMQAERTYRTYLWLSLSVLLWQCLHLSESALYC